MFLARLGGCGLRRGYGTTGGVDTRFQLHFVNAADYVATVLRPVPVGQRPAPTQTRANAHAL